MPLAIEITLNILWIPIIFIIGALAGFILRTAQLNRLKRKIFDSERQSLHQDAEILALQKENSQLMEQLKNNSAPVIPLTAKEPSENLPDTSTRKKLLSKTTAKQTS
jgi:hypothetical protein